MGRIVKKMKSCKIDATLLKSKIEAETCELQNKIMEYQGLDLEGLEREYNDDIGMVNTMETDYIDSIVSLKNMDDAIEVLEQGVARSDTIINYIGAMRRIANRAINVRSTDSDVSGYIEDNEEVFVKQQKLLE